MLNRAKLLQAIHEVHDDLFLDLSPEISNARSLWESIARDEFFAQMAQSIRSEILIPSWKGPLDKQYQIVPFKNPYGVLSVDGSQVYPDRHQGTSCCLINIGSVQLFYGLHNRVALASEPYVYTDDDDFDATVDLINCRRQELELKAGVALSKKIKSEYPEVPFIFLFDGSLIFWHLQSKEAEIKDYFLSRYMQMLDALYQDRILMAGYISLPKSKEIVNILRLKLCNFSPTDCPRFHELDHVVDTTIMRFFLQQSHRSIIFKNQSPITKHYPEHLKPCFFYIDIGCEVARIEIPQWVADNIECLEKVGALIANQVYKGQGYPIALAEAHEQAVVKGPDREFFYHLIQKISIEHNKKISISQKSLKKRRIGI